MNKVPLILFSGGYDSTDCLLNTLVHQQCDILTVWSNLLNYLAQQQSEKIAIERILDKINNDEELVYRVRNKYLQDMQFVGKSTGITDLTMGFGQPPFWLFTALITADSNIHSSVNISYIMGDDICYHAHYLKDAWESMWKACKVGEVVPLCFPFLDGEYKMSKTGIIADIDRNFPEYKELISYCETPLLKEGSTDEYLSCGVCRSCKKVIASTESYTFQSKLNIDDVIEIKE